MGRVGMKPDMVMTQAGACSIPETRVRKCVSGYGSRSAKDVLMAQDYEKISSTKSLEPVRSVLYSRLLLGVNPCGCYTVSASVLRSEDRWREEASRGHGCNGGLSCTNYELNAVPKYNTWLHSHNSEYVALK